MVTLGLTLPGGKLTHLGRCAENNTIWKSLESLSRNGQVTKWGFLVRQRESAGEASFVPSGHVWGS